MLLMQEISDRIWLILRKIIDSISKTLNFQSTNIFFVIFGFYYIVCNGNFGPLREHKKTTILEC